MEIIAVTWSIFDLRIQCTRQNYFTQFRPSKSNVKIDQVKTIIPFCQNAKYT